MTANDRLRRLLILYLLGLGLFQCYRYSTLPEEGILVKEVDSGLLISAANHFATEAGLSVGDVIVAVNNEQLTGATAMNPRWYVLNGVFSLAGQSVTNGYQSNMLLQSAALGSTIPYSIVRDGQQLTVSLPVTAFGFSIELQIVIAVFLLGAIVALRSRGLALQALHFMALLGLLRLAAVKPEPHYDVFAKLLDASMVLAFVVSTGPAWRLFERIVGAIINAIQQLIRLIGEGLRWLLLCIPLLSPFAVGIVALAIVWLIYAVHTLTFLDTETIPLFSIVRIRYMLFERGFFPFVILWTGVFGLLEVMVVWKHTVEAMSSRDSLNARIWDAFRRNDTEILNSVLNDPVFARGHYAISVSRLAQVFAQEPDSAAMRHAKEVILSGDEDAAVVALQPIYWAEVALPALGFLGTVVGLAQAMSQIGAELLAGQARPEELQKGFQSVALAFETTFLGLIGALIVGGGLHWLKVRIARYLALQGTFLDEVIGLWVATTVTTELMRARQLRDAGWRMFEALILGGEHDIFVDMRRVLLPGAALPAEGAELARALPDNVTRAVGTTEWE